MEMRVHIDTQRTQRGKIDTLERGHTEAIAVIEAIEAIEVIEAREHQNWFKQNWFQQNWFQQNWPN